jgi:branched-chain amino acid transport system permease protein
MCLIGGGFASFYGPVLGVAVFLVIRDVLSMLTDHWMLFYGLLFMAIILFLPEGILGLVKRVREPQTFHDTATEPHAPAAGHPRSIPASRHPLQ